MRIDYGVFTKKAAVSSAVLDRGTRVCRQAERKSVSPDVFALAEDVP